MPPDVSKQTQDMAIAVLREVAKQYPRAYQNCHRDENQHPEAYDFVILGTRALTLRDSNFGLNGKRGSFTDISSDALAYGTGTDVRVIDFLIGAGEHGNNLDRITWNDVTGVGGAGARWLNPFEWHTREDYRIKIIRGSSLFWLLQGYKNHQAKLDRNLTILKNGNFKYIRALGVLGGGNLDGHDPWSQAGYDVNSPDYEQVVQDATRYVYNNYGIKVFWTMFGSRDRVEQQHQQDRITQIMASIWEYVEDYEVENEYRHGNKLSLSEVRRQAQFLHSLINGQRRISLSSPWETHAGSSLDALHRETEEMHRGLPQVNMSTPHWDRTRPPSSPFIPGCNLGVYAPTYIVNNEWFGFGSYNSQGITANHMAVGYQESIRAGESKFTTHSNTGTWGGMIDPHWIDKNSPDYFDEQLGWNEMVDLFKHIEAGGVVLTTSGGSLPAPIPPEEEMKPYPDENTWWPQYEHEVTARYQKAFNEGKRSTPDLDPAAFRWFSRMGYDASHEDLTTAMRRHLSELEAGLGITYP